MARELVEPRHIGDGLYMKDNNWGVAIAVNHHENDVAFIEIEDIDKAINYLTEVKKRVKNGK